MTTDTHLSTPSPSITRSAAARLIAAVHFAAAEIGFDAAVAVTDVGGHLKAFERPDETPFLASEVAVDKAWTAASFRLATHVWNDYVSGPQVAPLAYHPRLMAVGGGFPIVENGRCIGGLGISGGTAEQDRQAAEIALTATGFDSAE
ncbi:GlcG/HbpS family heme-binding protein [Nocardia sp. NPDC004278]